MAPFALGASSLDARGARTIVSAARATSLVALAKSRSDFYADLNNAAAAATSSSSGLSAADPYRNEWMGFTSPESVQIKPSAAASRLADRYDRMNSPSAVDQSQGEWLGFAAPESVGSSSTSVPSHDISADFYGMPNVSPAAVNSALPAGFHDSSADFYGKPNTSSAADSYQNEWMGFTSPESVQIKPSAIDQYQNDWTSFTPRELLAAPKLSVDGSAADPSTSVKPEGINPSAAVDSAAKQVPWMKPEGIKVSGAK